MCAKINAENKLNGRVYTPKYIVDNILDLSGYIQNNILKKHVIDNSCGDGAFLKEVVNRYCKQAQANNHDKNQLKSELETYIHGIELDAGECEKCKKNVSDVASEFGVVNVNWDIICGDSLIIDKYNGKMDFVVGNPPYVRVHNLEDSFNEVKNYSFAQDGMTDLFIVFYEIGLKMLNETGVLGYITPSSFFNSVAGNYMRKYFVNQLLLNKIVDLKHYQAFNATTFTTIVILNKQHQTDMVEYYKFDEKNLIPFYVDTLSIDDYYILGKFYFAQKNELRLLKKIFNNLGHCGVEVKNGYATLCDSVFVGDFDFKSKHIIPVIKASRGITQQIIYPYDSDGRLISEDELKNDRALYEYLLEHKDVLAKRDAENKTDNKWFSFGRSQAINDTYKDKIVINSLMRTTGDLKINNAPKGTGVYSGLYILSNSDLYNDIIQALTCDEFNTYVALLGKYKSGGYYTFSSKDIKTYLDYKLAYDGGLLQL